MNQSKKPVKCLNGKIFVNGIFNLQLQLLHVRKAAAGKVGLIPHKLLQKPDDILIDSRTFSSHKHLVLFSNRSLLLLRAGFSENKGFFRAVQSKRAKHKQT
jgi:hypothetical protein